MTAQESDDLLADIREDIICAGIALGCVEEMSEPARFAATIQVLGELAEALRRVREGIAGAGLTLEAVTPPMDLEAVEAKEERAASRRRLRPLSRMGSLHGAAELLGRAVSARPYDEIAVIDAYHEFHQELMSMREEGR